MTAFVKPHCPDWTNPNNYPPAGCLEYERLAWEFIRRNVEYARYVNALCQLAPEEYDGKIRNTSNICLDYLTCVPSAEKGETARTYHQRMKSHGQVGRILRPKTVLASRWYMQSVVPAKPDTEYNEFDIAFVPHAVAKRTTKTTDATIFPLSLWPDEIAFRFRLDVGLTKQLAIATTRFKQAKAESVSGKDQKLRKIKEAHYWLRAYDAYRDLKAKGGTQRGSGPWTDVVREVLQREAKEKKVCKEHVIDEWRQTAEAYIEGGKFAMLLYEKRASTSDPLQRLNETMASSRKK
jgi:hypothetical protein